jgi:hypothetical protein
MPKATAIFDADDSRFGAALARINGKMLALQSRIAKFAVAFVAIRSAARIVGAGLALFFSTRTPGSITRESMAPRIRAAVAAAFTQRLVRALLTFLWEPLIRNDGLVQRRRQPAKHAPHQAQHEQPTNVAVRQSPE